jgi:hypothetical protein
MCNFFSFVSYRGKKYYFDELSMGEHDDYSSHSFICETFDLLEDMCNKYEIVCGKLVVDNIGNSEELLEDVQHWVDDFVASPKYQRILKKHQRWLAKLSGDKEYNVRQSIANNPYTASKTLTKLADDVWPIVRREVAGNTNTSRKTLVKLASDEDPNVCYIAKNNPNFPKTLT